MNRKQVTDTITTDEQGCVTINGTGFYEKWRPWGHPHGFGVEGNRLYEASPSGAARPILLNNVVAHGCGGAVESIKRSIPEPVLSAVHDYAHYELELIQLAECQPAAFLRLRRSNPCLLALMGKAIAGGGLLPVKHWGGLLDKDERDILEALGYSRTWASLLRKMSIHLAGYGYLQLALTAFRQPGCRILRHCEHVNLARLMLVHTRSDIVVRCPSILRFAGGDPGDPFESISAEIPTLVTEICYYRAQLGKEKWPWRRINDEHHLRRIHRDLTNRLMERGQMPEVAYPAPPFEPDYEWKWIGSNVELREHAERFSNCSLNLHWQLLAGEAFLYESRQFGPDAVVAVVEKMGDKWRLSEIHGIENAMVDPWIREQAALHFSHGEEVAQ